MSILYETKDRSVVLISHEKYIEKIYDNLSYVLNKDLFAINVPFKTQNSIKNELAKDNRFKRINEEINYVSVKYEGVRKEIIEHLTTTEAESNLKALELQRKLTQLSVPTKLRNASGGNTSKTPILTTVDSTSVILPSNCRFFNKNITELNASFKNERFDLIVVDPPWWNKAIRRKRKNMGEGYEMLRNEDLQSLPIGGLLEDDGLLVVWCTNSQQHETALINDCFNKWGVKLLAKWFWLKICVNGETVINFTSAPAKQPYERILIAAKRDMHIKETDGKLIISVPSALHSHKPPLDDILKCSGNKLEIFARYLLPNYTSYGLESTKMQNVKFYSIK